MRQWLELLNSVMVTGERRSDRTGIGTLSVFGRSLTFNNWDGDAFPAVTTKKLIFEQVAAELACFIRGFDTLDQFHSMGCKIWDANAEARGGQLGPIYGAQWRRWKRFIYEGGGEYTLSEEVDQLAQLVRGLQFSPHSRRHVVSAWNVGELDDMCLPPCHTFFQAYVGENGLSLSVYMRSVDLFLGLPFDVASYALLQRLIAREVGLRSHNLTFFLGDAHIYTNHFEQVKTVLSRKPQEPKPKLWLRDGVGLFDFKPDDVKLEGYSPWPAVPAPLNA